jgi:hypothetical protein
MANETHHHHHHHHHHYHHTFDQDQGGYDQNQWGGTGYDRQNAGYNRAGFMSEFGGGYGGYPATGQGRRGWSSGFGSYAGFSQGDQGYTQGRPRSGPQGFGAYSDDYYNGSYSGAGYQRDSEFGGAGQAGRFGRIGGGYSEDYNQNWVTGAGQRYGRQGATGYNTQRMGQDSARGSSGRQTFGGGYYGTPYLEQQGFGGYGGSMSPGTGSTRGDRGNWNVGDDQNFGYGAGSFGRGYGGYGGF